MSTVRRVQVPKARGSTFWCNSVLFLCPFIWDRTTMEYRLEMNPGVLWHRKEKKHYKIFMSFITSNFPPWTDKKALAGLTGITLLVLGFFFPLYLTTQISFFLQALTSLDNFLHTNLVLRKQRKSCSDRGRDYCHLWFFIQCQVL